MLCISIQHGVPGREYSSNGKDQASKASRRRTSVEERVLTHSTQIQEAGGF